MSSHSGFGRALSAFEPWGLKPPLHLLLVFSFAPRSCTQGSIFDMNRSDVMLSRTALITRSPDVFAVAYASRMLPIRRMVVVAAVVRVRFVMVVIRMYMVRVPVDGEG